LPVIAAEPLLDFAQRLFVAAGAPAEGARIVATSLVGANLRGHDSHGVMRVPFYIARIQDGGMRPASTLRFVH